MLVTFAPDGFEVLGLVDARIEFITSALMQYKIESVARAVDDRLVRLAGTTMS